MKYRAIISSRSDLTAVEFEASKDFEALIKVVANMIYRKSVPEYLANLEAVSKVFTGEGLAECIKNEDIAELSEEVDEASNEEFAHIVLLTNIDTKKIVYNCSENDYLPIIYLDEGKVFKN